MYQTYAAIHLLNLNTQRLRLESGYGGHNLPDGAERVEQEVRFLLPVRHAQPPQELREDAAVWLIDDAKLLVQLRGMGDRGKQA